MQPALSGKSCRSDRRNVPDQSHCSPAAEGDGTEQDEGPSGGRRGWFLMLWLVTTLKPVWKQLESHDKHDEGPGSGENPQQWRQYERPAYYVLGKLKFVSSWGFFKVKLPYVDYQNLKNRWKLLFFFAAVNWNNFVICIGREKEETDCSAVNSFLNFSCSYFLECLTIFIIFFWKVNLFYSYVTDCRKL